MRQALHATLALVTLKSHALLMSSWHRLLMGKERHTELDLQTKNESWSLYNSEEDI